MHSFEIVTPDRGIAAALHNKIDRKSIDFVLCDPNTYKVQLAIELDDRSHDHRQDRDDFVVAGERSAVGLRGKVDGDAYVAVGGPNKGSVVQPIREEGTGNLLAVPVERLARPTGSRGSSRARVGYSRRYADAYDRIFKKG